MFHTKLNIHYNVMIEKKNTINDIINSYHNEQSKWLQSHIHL